MVAMIKTTGKEKDYELIEYILNVNTQYTQALMELNENGAMDAAYTYGTARLMEERLTGESNFYLYDPSGNVAGITDQDGYLWQSYRYDAFGNATFGSPQYDNEYTFNGESYNPNIHSQYLRARYYDTVKGSFLTEDTYLGDIRNPLTLNRYSYCIGNPLFYSDPNGHAPRTPSSNPASPYNRIDFEARDQGIKEALGEIKRGLNNFSAGWTAGQMEIKYGIDPVGEFIDSNMCIIWTGGYNGKLVSKEDVEYLVDQQYENVDVEALSYAVGKGVSETAYYLQLLSMVSSACSMSTGGTTGNASGNMMVAGVSGEIYIVDGTMAMPIYVVSGSTFTFFKEDTEEKSEAGNWNKGSFNSAEESLEYHYNKHGDEVGATSQEQYLRKAEEFAKTAKKNSTRSWTYGATEGTIRYKKMENISIL